MKTVEVTYRYGAPDTPSRPRPADADEARRRLDEGNQAFAALLDGLHVGDGAARHVVQVDPRDLGLVSGDQATPKQRPFAAILGCSDARVPIELIFNEGPNDLFVIRVAGNGLGNEVLGSLKYAVERLDGSVKIVVALGHSGCGAVSTAVDVFLDPSRYLPLATSHSLRHILDRLLVVVQASAKRMQEVFGSDVTQYRGYRSALIEASIVVNAALAAFTMQKEVESSDSPGMRAVYGVYVLETRQIWAPRPGAAEWNALADPPSNRAAFVELGDAVLHSDRITSLLKAE